MKKALKFFPYFFQSIELGDPYLLYAAWNYPYFFFLLQFVQELRKKIKERQSNLPLSLQNTNRPAILYGGFWDLFLFVSRYVLYYSDSFPLKFCDLS